MDSYRKNPVVVKAVKWDEAPETLQLLQDAGLHDVKFTRSKLDGRIRNLGIWTLEGTMGVLPGDYIVQGVDDEFYPCKADIFDVLHTKEVING